MRGDLLVPTHQNSGLSDPEPRRSDGYSSFTDVNGGTPMAVFGDCKVDGPVSSRLVGHSCRLPSVSGPGKDPPVKKVGPTQNRKGP